MITNTRLAGRTARLAAASLIWMACSACSSLTFDPTPVVPTKHQLPYTARVHLQDLAAYIVEPGVSMSADPDLQNHVTGTADDLGKAAKEWEQAIVTYIGSRQTFRELKQEGPADLDVTMRLIIYIDPSYRQQFNQVYIARTDASIAAHRTGTEIRRLSGFGKAFGPGSGSGKDVTEGPLNKAVHVALNDLFNKLEQDAYLARFALGSQ